MQRRGGARQSVKGQRAARSKPRKASTVTSPKADLQEQLDQRTRELEEALEQQAAASEVLQVISRSSGDLEPVFQAMLANATRLCEAKFGILFRHEGGLFHPTASLDVPPAFADFLKRQGSFAGKPGQLFGRLCQSKRVIHVVDRATEPEPSPSVRYAGARSCIAVPMLKENGLVGAFFIYRTEVRPFTDKQIELVKNFAAQAVIAIENTRLLNEQRESLERQTATSEVLQTISSSPGELKPVFEAMLTNATRLCKAEFGILFRVKDGAAVPVATLGLPDAFMELVQRRPLRPSQNAPIMRAARTKQIVHVADLSKEQVYIERDPMVVVGVEVVGIRTLLVVPMLKDDEFIAVTLSSDKRCTHSPTNRSNWSPTLPRKPSLPSRTRGC
jgi:GAF domain-containing protein